MSKVKKAAAIHDISGFGKCSLTVALPILSAAGIETSVIPTAVLSTHTGGFTGYTYRDLTEDMLPFERHWKSLGLEFDAIYSGFLGSFRQLQIVSEIISDFKKDGTIVLVDPVMGDNGALYNGFRDDFVGGMAALCGKADIIVPNLTEAAMLLNKEYREGPFETAEIEEIVRGLAGLGPKQVALTGVQLASGEFGTACYDRAADEIRYAFCTREKGFFHGTGDIFASVLLAGLLNGKSLADASRLAVDFTSRSIRRTVEAGTDLRNGVSFEAELPFLMRSLGL